MALPASLLPVLSSARQPTSPPQLMCLAGLGIACSRETDGDPGEYTCPACNECLARPGTEASRIPADRRDGHGYHKGSRNKLTPELLRPQEGSAEQMRSGTWKCSPKGQEVKPTRSWWCGHQGCPPQTAAPLPERSGSREFNSVLSYKKPLTHYDLIS